MKQYEVLKWASVFLKEHNREEKVAELLLQHHLSVPRATFYMQMRENIPANIIEKFKVDIVKHVKTGVPVQHLIGYEHFYGRTFSVNKDVLIPRPETEELIQCTIDHVKSNFTGADHPVIVDIGTGSGVIAITLALELPNATIYATDISTAALAVAKKNAANLGANVIFLTGDFLQPLIELQEKADIIVSNPPYIAREDVDSLVDTVKNFDPELALFANENGLAAYRKIVNQLPEAMEAKCSLFLEIGHNQGEAVTNIIMDTFPTANVNVLQDMNKKDRIITAKLE